MLRHESSLPEAWVERIFATMRATYGAAFDRQWECPAGADVAAHMQAIKAHWGRELARFQQSPDAIRYALDNLPTYPPNLIEFRATCNRRPDAPAPQLPAPKPDPERLAAELGRMAATRSAAPSVDRLGWARRVLAREETGERITITVRSMALSALGLATGAKS